MIPPEAVSMVKALGLTMLALWLFICALFPLIYFIPVAVATAVAMWKVITL